jgi:hypothetical protein
MSWAFVLEPIGASAAHLAVRVRVTYRPGLTMALMLPVASLEHEIMQRRQLRNLKQRAEDEGALTRVP